MKQTIVGLIGVSSHSSETFQAPQNAKDEDGNLEETHMLGNCHEIS